MYENNANEEFTSDKLQMNKSKKYLSFNKRI